MEPSPPSQSVADRRHGYCRDESILALQSLDERVVRVVVDLLDFDLWWEVLQVRRISCEDGDLCASAMHHKVLAEMFSGRFQQ
jgi:hypothetical protein